MTDTITLDDIKTFCLDTLSAIRELDVNCIHTHHAIISSEGKLDVSRSNVEDAFALIDSPYEVIIRLGLPSNGIEKVHFTKTAQGFSTSYPLHEIITTLKEKGLL